MHEEGDMQRVYTALASGVVVLDAQGCVVEANAAAEEILGVSLDALRGHSLASPRWAASCPDGAPLPVAERPAMVALRTHQPVRGVTVRLGSPDGTERWVQIDAVPLLDEAGAVERIVVSYVDLTARIRAEEALQESEARFRALSEHGSDLVCILAPDGSARYGSPSYERVLGAPIEALHRLAGSPLAAIHPDDQEHVHAALRACVDEGAPGVTLTCRHRHADGSYRTLEAVATNRLHDPAIGGIVVTSRDVTARVAAEARVRAGEQWLQTVIANAPIVLTAVDAEGIVTFSAGSGLARIGRTPQSTVGQSIFDVLADAPTAQAYVLRALGGESCSGIIHLRGTVFESHYAPLLDDAGKVCGAVGVSTDVTERAQAEEARRASEERFRALTEHGSDLVSILAPDGTVLYDSPSHERVLGAPLAEVQRRAGGPIAAIHPDDWERVQEAFAACMGGAAPTVAVTCRHRHADGSWRTLECVVTNALGNPAIGGLVLTSRDVTERQAAEEARAQLAAIVEASDDAIFGKTLDGLVTAWNGGAERLYGYTAAEMLGQSVALLIPPDCPGELADLMQAVARGETIRQYETERVRKDGTRIAVALTITPIRGRDGAVVSASVVARDITARKAAEEALRASEERYRQVQEHAPIGLALVSPDGRWLRVNPALCALVGYAEEELLERTFQDITHPDDLDADLDQVRQVLVGEIDTYRMEKRYIRKDGSLVWVLLAVSLVRDAAGAPLYFIAQIQDIDERKRDEERLRHVAHHDALTGLPNRILFNDRLGQALLSAERTRRALAVLLIDLNRFKEVNDTLGHDAGDALLQTVASRMREALRASDTVARLGGDEFAVLLPHTDEAGAAQAAAKIVAALTAPVGVGGHRVQAGGSAGIACYPAHGVDAATLLRHADVAMYEAKRSGSGVAVYAPERDGHTVERLELAAELPQAIAAGQLELHYQPIVDLASGRPLVVEALARWRHPARGLMMPDAFIPLAEETGAIVPLTEWVLDAALACCGGWGEAGLGVAVNLSARALHDAELPARVACLLGRYGVAPERLTLEIAEGAVMRQPARVLAVLRRLKEIGVRLAIDDFGAGSSSLELLQELPIDGIKVDRSFVRRADEGAQGMPIIAFVLGLARSCGLEAIVEGVETPAMRALLEALGCDAAQGYLFAHPLPADELAVWLATSGTGNAPGAA